MSAPAIVPSVPRQHVVEFYETDAGLAGSVARFLAPAIAEPGAAIVVATAAHRAVFDEALIAAGVDVAGAVAAGRYLSIDAAALLSRVMVDGVPDEARFQRALGAVLERMSARSHALRIYGEMAALLWEGGDVASAVALEDFWNHLGSTFDVDLLCAYRLAALDDEDHALAFRRVCEQHQCRPEQALLAELAYAGAVAHVFNRRASTAGPVAADMAGKPGLDSLILSAWRNPSQLMSSPGGRVLGHIVAETFASGPEPMG
jgi:hypothetical protein